MEQDVEEARGRVATIIGADPREIVFTSGATESNNLAIKGVARFYGDRKRAHRHRAHRAQMRARLCRHLQQEGFEITYLPVDPNGLLDLDRLRDAIGKRTALVSSWASTMRSG